MIIQSHRGPYEVHELATVEEIATTIAAYVEPVSLIVDTRIADLYAGPLAPLFERVRPVLIEATEENKSLARMESHVDALMTRGARRNHVLIAIGGGIIQDVSCFVASTLFRGMPWELIPTTLLAQADSSIGSKSSINVGPYKNLMGTFVPPRRIYTCDRFLQTLSAVDIRSGIGEILKVHILAGQDVFETIRETDLLRDEAARRHAIRRSLEIKQGYIEEDEFDRGPRNVLNYGHSFGHAIESATEFRVPHGIAVTIGMDLANHVATWRGDLPPLTRDRMRGPLRRNAGEFLDVPIPLDRFFSALGRDKKNEGTRFAFILLDESGRGRKVLLEDTPALRECCAAYFAGLGAR